MLTPVIGLEIHLQLKTASKMFCSCFAHDFGQTPNMHTCQICLGHPGVLPVLNKEAVKLGVKMGIALNGIIASHSKFDRKHYFYPDLSKGYQISQYDEPIIQGGFIEIESPESPYERFTIKITRAHLEEDAAKNTHSKTGSKVDYNRAGTPLLEIVTEPDFKTPEQAKWFLQELQLIAKTLGISDAEMEKGQMRCDANISLREVDESGNVIGNLFNPKTEIKNINSFRHVERALGFEIKRQTELWESGKPISISTTRGWNDERGVTELQRSKEEASDYRYFPEPDIPPLSLVELGREIHKTILELPKEKRIRFENEYGLKKSDARFLVSNPNFSEHVEGVISELYNWLSEIKTEETSDEDEKKIVSKMISGWYISKFMKLMIEKNIPLSECLITKENLAELFMMIIRKQVNQISAQKILEIMIEKGGDPSQILEEHDLKSDHSSNELLEFVREIPHSHKEEFDRYKNGETKLLMYFVGIIMKKTKGKAMADEIKSILEKEL